MIPASVPPLMAAHQVRWLFGAGSVRSRSLEVEPHVPARVSAKEVAGMFIGKLRSSSVVLVLSAAMMPLPMLAQDANAVAGLKAPRGLSFAESGLLIAEQGTGRILAVGADGTSKPVVDGIVSGQYESPEGPAVAGVSAAIKVGDTYYFIVGGSLGVVSGSSMVYSAAEGQDPVLLADLARYEEENNTGGDVTQAGDPDIESNPFDLVSDGRDGLYVSDAAANAVFHISADGTVMLYALFMDRENPLAPNLGGPTIDQVPTGLTMGPDRALYTSTLTGFPFPAGAARVYRIVDANADGDALDDGELTVFAEGLTTATDLAFEANGDLLVTEFSTDMLSQAPGRLVRIVDGIVTEVMGPLVSPTGLAALPNGSIAVSQESAGLVTIQGP